MIEVNLLPGGRKKRRKGPRLSLSLPSFGGGGGVEPPDKFVLGAAVTISIVLGVIGYTFVSLNGQIEEAQVALEEQLEDSARFSSLMQRTAELTARRDSILQRISVIQEIDRERYVWPHIMDELARALPNYLWLTGVSEISPFPSFELLIDGGAGDNTAVTTFMQRLEASPFFREIRIINSTLSTDGAEQFYQFQLQLYFELPGEEFIETVPLFDEAVGPPAGSSGAETEAADASPAEGAS